MSNQPDHDQGPLVAAMIQDALDQWVALTGVDLNATHWSYRDWDVRTMNEELKETLRLDPAGTTTYLLLECFLREYLKQRTFTVAEIMQDYAGLTSYLAKAEQLFSVVQSEQACELAAHFQARVIDGLRHYRADRDDVLEMVNNADILPFLRRDALRSIESLQAYQFLAGSGDDRPPQVIDRVYQAWDINQLLVALRDMPVSGVVLVLLRDPEQTSRSYFCFALRNGDNVIILTDKTKWAHPAQADMIRRPDRVFQTRAWKNHFPYQLIKHHLDDKGDVVFDTETQLVTEGLDMVPLLSIKDLPPHQVIWVVMMLSLIGETFWRKSWQAPALSYTAGMIKVKDQLVTDHTGRHLPIAATYQPITLDRLKVEDVSAGAMAAQTAGEPKRVNAWLEERYRDQVTDDVINQWIPGEGKILQLPAVGNGTAIEIAKANDHHFWIGDARPYELRGMRTTEFGTEEDLRQDQIWLARFNMARQIQKSADEEFAARKAEVFAWYQAKVTVNLPALLQAISAGTMPGLRVFRGVTGGQEQAGDILTFGKMGDEKVWSHYDVHTGVRLGPWDRAAGKYGRRCVLTGAAATYRARFRPETAASLAQLAGCAVEDLPDVLQNWRREKPDVGNDILTRLDPMDTEVNDPWMELEVNVNVYLSKRGYAKIGRGIFQWNRGERRGEKR